MKIHKIIRAIETNCVNITLHARKEAKDDSLRLDDIFFSTCHGEIIEDYPDDFPYPSCLIYGRSSSDDPVHSVWAYDSENEIAVLITVYRPDPERWTHWKERKDT
ncbi:DUF4258 domain-containing protein [Desulfonema magnum]|uniref:DUF4258 n=1 Tax=Desulfonema magnum TaxID=45655 RepID=A0A975BIV9_9BACT|nr:DUF4258 domain-containing protein [Desulfonema magnum]QTA86151.1 DUF4258 [Desulfonema magnum]